MNGFQTPLSHDSPEAQIGKLADAFFHAFDNRSGPPNVDSLRQLMLPTATVIKAGQDGLTVMSVDDFLAPRKKLLEGGDLKDFHEWELEATTFVFGKIATRVCRYAKKGMLFGEDYEGCGWKSLQLVLTGDGWRISAVIWQDEDAESPFTAASWYQVPESL